MSTVKDGSALTSFTFFGNGTVAANFSAICAQFVGPPMPAGINFTTAQTVKCVFRCLESATNDNINRQPIALKVYAANGTTLQATLKALGHYGPGTTEWSNTTLTNRQGADGDVLDTNYTTVAGDLLVLEIGGQVSSSGGTTVTGSIEVGSSAGADLAENETGTTANNPWLELSTTITFRFAATAAVTTGPATAAGAATFVKPTFSGTAAVTTGHATAAVTGTFTRPTYTATGAATTGKATAAATGTFSSPNRTATAALTVGAVIGSGQAAHSNKPVGILTQARQGIGGRRYAPFTAKTETPLRFEAVGTLTAGAATLAATASAYDHHNVGILTQARQGIGGRRYGSFAAKGSPNRTATAALVAGAATLTAAATFTKPEYDASGGWLIGAATASGAATFDEPAYTATAAVTVGHATAAATATFAKPTYSAAGTLTAGHATLAGTATGGAPTHTGTAVLNVGPVTMAAVADVTNPTYSATGAATTGPATLAGSASFGTNVFLAAGNVATGPATLTAGATFNPPTYTAAGDLETAPVDFEAVSGPVTFAIDNRTIAGIGTRSISAAGRQRSQSITGRPPN